MNDYIQNRNAKVIPVTQAGLDKYWEEQPLPEENDLPHTTDLVVSDLQKRKELGIAKYGVALQSFNGRNSLQDLYEELLDAALYCKNELEENKVEKDTNTKLLQYNSDLLKENAYLKSIYIQANYINQLYDENRREKSKLKKLWNLLFTNSEDAEVAFNALTENIMDYRMSLDEQTSTNT